MPRQFGLKFQTRGIPEREKSALRRDFYCDRRITIKVFFFTVR